MRTKIVSVYRKRYSGLVLAAVPLALALCGCNQETDSAAEANAVAVKSSLPSSLNPDQFFPMKLGHKWAYRITIGETEPIKYAEVIRPLGSGMVVSAQRSRFLPLLGESPQRSFRLELSVKATAPAQGPLRYPEGVRIAVIKDELGVFEGVQDVFLAVSRSSRYEALLVTTFPPAPSSYPGSWGAWDAKSGHALRLLFFGERPYTQIGLGRDQKDALLFVGPESASPVRGVSGPVLHFTRSVEPAEKRGGDDSDGSILNQGFVEETYWGLGKGLIYLRQAIGGKTSMTWELVTDLGA